MRKVESQKFWEEEKLYIFRVAQSKAYGLFRDDPGCFQRYCQFQAGRAAEDGFQEISLQILAACNEGTKRDNFAKQVEL